MEDTLSDSFLPECGFIFIISLIDILTRYRFTGLKYFSLRIVNEFLCCLLASSVVSYKSHMFE